MTLQRPMVDLSTRVGEVELVSPVMTASGTAGHGAELGAYVDLSTLGAVVVKSLAWFACKGNPAVRVYQTPSGMINSVGLQGDGIELWLKNEYRDLCMAKAKVVVSIWGRTVQDYGRAAELLAEVAADGALGSGGALGPGDSLGPIVAVEVYISCPNSEKGNQLFAHSAKDTREIMEVTSACGLPRWAKLSPNVGPELVRIADAAANGGASAVTLINTFFGLSIDPVTRRSRLGTATGEPGRSGGVSGPAIHPLAVRAVADVHAAIPELPIVAVGGVASVEDIVEFALVGASAIQVGTANFADPRICGRLTTNLHAWCAKQGISRFTDLVGEAIL